MIKLKIKFCIFTFFAFHELDSQDLNVFSEVQKFMHEEVVNMSESVHVCASLQMI